MSKKEKYLYCAECECMTNHSTSQHDEEYETHELYTRQEERDSTQTPRPGFQMIHLY